MGRIAALRHRLAHLRRRLAPQREVLAALARPGQPVVRERTVVYFRDVQDHVVRITEELDVARDLVSQTMEIYLSSVNNRISLRHGPDGARRHHLPAPHLHHELLRDEPARDRPDLGWWLVGGTTLVLLPAMFLLFKRRGWF